MENISLLTAALIVISIVFLVAFLLFCYSLNSILTWIAAWLCSRREEKVGLTRLKGLYNANGYLVHSESEIHLDSRGGSFKRFDSVDKDVKSPDVTTSLMGHLNNAINDAAVDDILPEVITAPAVPSIENELPLIGNNKLVSSEEVNGNSATTVPLTRAVSCDSVCSDNSVALGDLENNNTTGYLCIGLEYDSDHFDLIVNVLEAKDLKCPNPQTEQTESYVRIFLLPDKLATIQTRVCRASHGPNYKERFLFSLNPREQAQRTLCFHVYSTDLQTHTLIGEGEIRLADVSLRQPVTTWITLTDTGQKGTEFGELMFSLSYLPTAERLTVVVVKARNLKFENAAKGNTFIKVYLMHHGRKICKKKTSIKKGEKSPIFNEAMIFSVPAHTLTTIQLRLTVTEILQSHPTKNSPIGHVIVSPRGSGRSLSHWNQMLTALRKPVAMWHNLRK